MLVTAIMLITNLHALVALVPLVASLPSMPSFMNRLKYLSSHDDQCPYPVHYKITSLQVWTPKNGNTHPMVIDFQYADEETKIATSCHYNGTQPNIAPTGLRSAQYACEDPSVRFIWDTEESSLSMIELACPHTPESGMEALDQITPRLSCVDTSKSTPFGEGSQCFSLDFAILGNFTALDPIEPPGNN
ncbi:hypothetical protein SMACR_04579 [Sordaria macrospora]|uniref:WGS project CABT00000000 data, contig 2.20 n=2 Tax=Sordaria macrospora TaxID=5147 RepID=F7W1V7_SORMK|nr:uncharacterized protein SMAC_04579 [Sordaria macrospora k-hell]KAA8636010.1 hypothetical protein SMACR_04579 [Sordaria macrospora]KAH7634846.1 hypothetical protein B0T09DRAFT_327370 [Sordaria sp. MPI-SDFR-AT-0083]WPJ58381.1 hypothetical protein SMAC4_04579 [Sordaria macrospora]CCC11594.1 unnamed protein product [Sordaria macrospora k-hell]